MNDLIINGDTIEVENEKISFSGKKIKDAYLHNNYLVVVFSFGKSNNQNYWNNVIGVDVNTHEHVWQIEDNFDRKRDYRNPYVGVAFKLCNDRYVVLNKLDSWKVAVDPKTGKILKNIDLNTGNRPW